MKDNKLIITRREKLAKLRAEQNPFVNNFKPTHLAFDLMSNYGNSNKEELAKQNVKVAVAGRLMLKRVMGKSSFATIMDRSGKIQLFLTRDDLAQGVYNEQFKKLDIGDIIGIKGILFKTKTNELSIKVTTIKLLTKAVRPLPEKFHGLNDTELKYRRRYLDLIINDEAKTIFTMRTKIINYLRNFFIAKNFMEVETPMMQVIPGGASAKPFITHHNALNMDFYLRIAPELYLKRLVIGGFERVFEINRNFRNEGLSSKHNPEFTMLEFYQAYANYIDLMDLTEELLNGIARNIIGNTTINYGNYSFDFAQPFNRLKLFDAILQYNKNLTTNDLTENNIKKTAINLGVKLEDNWGLGKIYTAIFENTVETKLIQPTFITEYPAEVSPLARTNDDNCFVTDRFELFIGGREIANGFNELNDYDSQRQKFLAQAAAKKAGDDEAMFYDADYIEALEYGMPPTAGEGIGIDRLVMLFTNQHTIKDVLLFPHMKP